MTDAGKQVGEFSLARKALEKWWAMLRPLRGGTDAMREAGPELLPMDWLEVLNNDPSQPRYAERVRRSFLFAAYDDSIERIAARPFQKAIQVTPPEELAAELQPLEKNADLMGTSLTMFGQQLLEDKADRGFALFIVDHAPLPDEEEPETDIDGKPKTAPDGRPVLRKVVEKDEAGQPKKDPAGKPIAKKQNLNLDERMTKGIRPYFARITPDNLVGWRDEMRDGVKEIIELRVRSQETRTVQDFTEVKYDRVTVWKETTVEVWEKPLETNSTDRAQREMIRQEAERGHKLVEGPKPHGFPGNRIPLVVSYAGKRIDTLYVRPPMLNLADMNVAHWQSDSQQRHILHYARIPIFWASGMTKDEAAAKLKLGPGASLLSSDPEFECGYAEPGGSSLEAGRKDVEHTEARMHALGMAPLTETTGPATATGEVRAESKNQAATLQWVEALEAALRKGYELAAEWVGQKLPEDFKLTIWRDFTIMQRSQQDLTTLDGARQRGDISQETYLQELKDRGVLNQQLDIQDEIARVEAEGPSLAELTAQANGFGAGPPGEDSEDPEEEEPEEGEEAKPGAKAPFPPAKKAAPPMVKA